MKRESFGSLFYFQRFFQVIFFLRISHYLWKKVRTMFDNADLSNKKVVVRVDFNVPLDSNLNVTDDTRIRAAIPTIRELHHRGARVILMSHLGRPLKDLNEDGSIKTKYSLKNIVSSLSDSLNLDVIFIATSVQDNAILTDIENTGDNRIILLENTRFYKGEEKGDPELARKMAALGDYYVNDAFGTAHREHASTATIARYFDKDHKSFGFLMDKEVSNISRVLDDIQKPFCAILGGAKVSDKIKLIENLLDKADKIIIGGGMAFTFIKAQGGTIGKSLCEDDKLDLANQLLAKAGEKGVELLLPVDAKVSETFSNDGLFVTKPIDDIPDGWMGLDIGEASISLFEEAILSSKMILWNGPMGVFEFSNFAHGTFEIASALAKVTKNGAFTLVGGGDSVAAISKAGLDDSVSFVSTGGGAMLEMIEGQVLPGVAAMQA